MTEQRFSDVRFSELNFSDELIAGVQNAGFDFCTPIQAETLPMALAGRDVAGKARTGTGKTAAFLLATMQRLIGASGTGLESSPHPEGDGRDDGESGEERPKSARPRALIMAPTRELAVQIHADALALGESTSLRFALVFGGTGYEKQKALFESPVDVLIGTPGRLIDFLKQRLYTLKGVEVLVLDEADRMFDLGFIKDIRYLLRRCPPPAERLNMLFSATLGYRVLELAYEHMNDPQLVNVAADQVTVDEVSQTIYHTANEEKISLLLGLIAKLAPERSIVFVNTKRAAERVSNYLRGNQIAAALLSGDVPQRKRLRLLSEFQSGDVPVLVATDVAARGLHIDGVTHVFNYDLPQDAEDYVHRIGRTARAGATGTAVSFACEEYVFSLPDIESYIEQALPVEPITDDLLVTPQPPVRDKSERVQSPRRRPRPRRRSRAKAPTP